MMSDELFDYDQAFIGKPHSSTPIVIIEQERYDAMVAELAEKQAYVLQLERALGEAWEPVPNNVTIVFPDTGWPWVSETGAEVRYCSRTSSSPTAGE